MSAPDNRTTPHAEELRSIHLFSRLDDVQLAAVAETMRVVRLAEGQRLFELGQPAKHFFYLRYGQLKLYRLSADGAEKVIEIVGPRETFAEAIMFMERSQGYPVNAEAISPSEVFAFDQEVMVAILRGSIDTCFRLMAAMSRRLRQHVDEIDRLTLHNATFRLVSYLLQQVPAGVMESPELQLTTPKHVIASRLAIQPETFSRILARLAKDGLVQIQRQNIVLTDVDGLRELVGP